MQRTVLLRAPACPPTVIRAHHLMHRSPWSAICALIAALALGASSPRGACAQRVTDPPITYSSLSVPEVFEGQLRRTSTTYVDSFFDRYWVRVRRGQVISVRVESSAFDPVLFVAPLGGARGLGDDDGGGGTTALVTERFEHDTVIVVVVRATQAGAVGAYRITVAEPPTLVGSASRSGVLRDSDVWVENGVYADYFLFDGRAGEQMRFILRSSDFDALLRVLTPDGDVLGENDDFGGRSDAQLDVTLPRTGRYYAMITAFGPPGLGDYALTWARSEASPERTSAPTPAPAVSGGSIQVGQRIAGEITASDSRACAEQALCDVYTHDGRAGDRLTIVMESTSQTLDPMLMLFAPDGRVLGVNDDDPAGGTNARLDVTLPASGRYRLGARNVSTSLGAYTLEVRRAP